MVSYFGGLLEVASYCVECLHGNKLNLPVIREMQYNIALKFYKNNSILIHFIVSMCHYAQDPLLVCIFYLLSPISYFYPACI